MSRPPAPPDDSPAVLRVGDLAIRPISREDVARYRDDFLALRNDKEAARLSLARPRRQDQAAIERWVEHRNGQESCHLFGIFGTESLLGYALVQSEAPDGRVGDLGLVLDRRHRGRGHGKAVVGALARHCRTALGYRRVTARILEENAASIRVFEACGFRRIDCLEGYRTPAGEVGDLLIFEFSQDSGHNGD